MKHIKPHKLNSIGSLFIILFICFFSFSAFSQTDNNSSISKINLDPEKVEIFGKYIEFRHSLEPGGFDVWKKNNPDLYEKEMWYYTESFYIKRNYLTEGISLNEGSIYIPRFESSRKPTTESIVVLPGFKDALVLIPANQLIYKDN
jgi:hypothetical protein